MRSVDSPPALRTAGVPARWLERTR